MSVLKKRLVNVSSQIKKMLVIFTPLKVVGRCNFKGVKI